MNTDSLPREPESERYVLGAIITFPDCRDEATKLLKATDFVDPLHAAIYDTFSQQHANGGIDPRLAAREVRHFPDFADGGNAFGFLLGLGEGVATSVHVAHEAGKIVGARKKRQYIDYAKSLVEHAQNGYTPDQIFNEAWAGLDDMRREAPVNQREKFTFGELRELHPHLNPSVVDGLFRSGETVNIISTSKVGKSWLAYYLALCIITGRKWFNQFETSPGRVFLIDNELHKPTLSHRVPVVADALGIPKEHYNDDLEVWSLRGRLRSLQAITPDIMAIRPGEFQLILLDAKYRFAAPGKSENDNAAETAEYNLLDQWAEHTGAAIGIIHHSSKGNQSDKRVTDVGAGAGAQSRAADCHIVLREHEEPDTVVLDAAVRSFAPVEPLPLRWSFPLWIPADGIDPTMLKGKQTASEERQRERDKQGIDKILAALLKDGKATARQLRAKTELSRERLQKLLDRLEVEGHITAIEITNRGNPTNEYAIKADSK